MIAEGTYLLESIKSSTKDWLTNRENSHGDADDYADYKKIYTFLLFLRFKVPKYKGDQKPLAIKVP